MLLMRRRDRGAPYSLSWRGRLDRWRIALEARKHTGIEDHIRRDGHAPLRAARQAAVARCTGRTVPLLQQALLSFAHPDLLGLDVEALAVLACDPHEHVAALLGNDERRVLRVIPLRLITLVA